jgi:hypothetical protein
LGGAGIVDAAVLFFIIGSEYVTDDAGVGVSRISEYVW